MSRPIRVAVCVPNLLRNGVFQWLLDLVSHTDPHAIEWVGCLLSGRRKPHVECARKLSRWLPIHCGDPCNWAGYYWARDSVRVHLSTEDAAAAAFANADVVITWEIDAWFSSINIQIPVMLVSHSTWWKPGRDVNATYFAAVSKAAAIPFERAGLPTAIIHSGVSADRCLPRLAPGILRGDWRAGPGHKVLLTLGRQDANKQPLMAGVLVQHLGQTFKACLYGESNTGEINSSVLAMAQQSGGQVIARPWYDHVGDLYAASDLLVVPSYRESFGQTIVEAWMAGLPVLCADGVGCVPELEAVHGPLTYKFPGREADNVELLTEHIKNIVTNNPSPEIVERAQKLAESYLTAGMMARRWEDHLRSLKLTRSPVVPVGRPTRRRWWPPYRCPRAVLFCRQMTAELEELLTRHHSIHWLAVVITEPQAELMPERPDWAKNLTVVTDLSGPEWAERWHDLRDGLHFRAKVADAVVVSDLPYADTALVRTTAPAVGLLLLTDAPAAGAWHAGLAAVLQTLTSPAELYQTLSELCAGPEVVKKPLKALMICPHIGWGGSERWMESLFLHCDGHTQWVGCAQIWSDMLNVEMAKRFEDAGVELALPANLSEGGYSDPAEGVAELVLRRGPDVIVFWGVENVGRFIPAAYHGPVVSVSHGVASDAWTRRWVGTSAPYASHYAAVSYLAVGSYPGHLQEQVDVLYPGVEFPEITLTPAARDALRAELGFKAEDKVIAYVGRGDPAKQPLRVAEIVALMPENYKVLWVGDSSDYPGNLEADLAKLVPGRFVRLPYTEQIDRIMIASDVLVLLSRYESFGMVIVQALHHGCRVLTTPVSIAGELLGDPAGEIAANLVSADATLELLVEKTRELAETPPTPLSPVLQARYGAKNCADQFHEYLQYVRSDTREGVGISLFSLVQAEPDWSEVEKPRAVACDAIVVLGEDLERNLESVLSLLEQREASVFVHAYGTPESCEALKPRLGPGFWRVALYPDYMPHLPFDWVWQHLDVFRTDVILFSRAGCVSLPDRANTCARYILGSGLELVVGAATNWRALSKETLGDEYATLAFRKGTLVDMLFEQDNVATVEAMLKNAEYRNRAIHKLAAPVCRIQNSMKSALTVNGPETHKLLQGTECVDMVLPFKNQFELLVETLDGVFNQQKSTVNLHLVASASSDRATTEALFAKYRGRVNGHPVHTYWAKSDIGQFLSANAVVPRMETGILLIQDGDDISEPWRAFDTARAMKLAKADLFSSSVRAFGGDLRILAASYPRPGSWYYAPNPSCAVTRQLMERLGGYADFGHIDRNRTSLDTEFFIRAYQAQAATQICGRPLVRYRQHPQSCVNSKATGFVSDARRFVEWEMIKQARALQSPAKGALASCVDLIERV